MSDWRSEIASKDRSEYFGEEDAISYFSSDGFYPGYYSQKLKVCFIGREMRWGESDIIEQILKENLDETKKETNTAFTRHEAYIVHGIKNNGKLTFEEVKAKTAKTIYKEMIENNDYGYSFINISKYSNWCDDGGKADFYAINKFLEHSNLEKRNFFREELEILSPDIIITMNLWDGHIEQKYLDLCFGKIEWEQTDDDDIKGIVNVSTIDLCGKSTKLLNTYHFSVPWEDKKYFYDPVMKIIFGERNQ